MPMMFQTLMFIGKKLKKWYIHRIEDFNRPNIYRKWSACIAVSSTVSLAEEYAHSDQ